MGPCISAESPQTFTKGAKFSFSVEQLHLTSILMISSGAYADVWKCKDTQTNKFYACKCQKLQTKELKNMFEMEVSWLKILKRKNIQSVTKYYGSKIISTKDVEIGVIVTDLYDYTLFELMKENVITLEYYLAVMEGIGKGIEGLHDCGGMHLDLKVENILCRKIDHKLEVAVCDFGSCKEFPIPIKSMSKADVSKLKEWIESNCTLSYRSPEMITLTKELTPKCDAWMLGCLGYILLYQKHPFEGTGLLAIVGGSVEFKKETECKVEGLKGEQFEEVIEILKKLLKVEGEKRISISEAVEEFSKIKVNNE